MNFDYVYKFHKATDNSKNALLNRKIWLSSQESLNDPFEGVTKTIYPNDRETLITKCINYMIEMLCGEESIEKAMLEILFFRDTLKIQTHFLK